MPRKLGWVRDGDTFILVRRDGSLAPFCVNGVKDAVEYAREMIAQADEIFEAIPTLVEIEKIGASMKHGVDG